MKGTIGRPDCRASQTILGAKTVSWLPKKTSRGSCQLLLSITLLR